jgi:ComF family protein
MSTAMIAQTFAPLLDLIYPPRCPLCGDALASQHGLCAGCWGTLVIPGDPACRKCQRPFENAIGAGAICGPCLAVPPEHDGIAAAALYNDPARRLILAFKHGRRIALAPLLARLISPRLPEMEEDWLVVPVPLHRGRLWRRGFNQAALLAREIAKHRGGRLLVDGLLRHKPTPVLGGLGRKARARALSGALAVNPTHRERIRGSRIVLVDDVLTSGATSGACVATLKRAGAEKVMIACFARVLDEALDVAARGPQ